MLELIAVGVGYGLLLSIMVGPAFFVLIETSILKGSKAGLFLDLGVLISDLMYITLAFLFYEQITELIAGDNQFLMKIIGGGFFIAFGLINLLKKKLSIKNLVNPQDLTASTYIMTMVKGFTINVLNPGIIFYWLTLMTLLPSPHSSLGLGRTQAVMIYIALILITFFSIDVLKIFAAKKLKEILTPEWMKIINIVLGVILVLFGSVFLIQGLIAITK